MPRKTVVKSISQDYPPNQRKRRRALSSKDRGEQSEKRDLDQPETVGTIVKGDKDPSAAEQGILREAADAEESLQVGTSSQGKRNEELAAKTGSHAENWEARAFERIKLDGLAKKNRRWHVLIPKTRNVLRLRGMKCVKLGAMYPSPESAARAADCALIAMWGKLDAEDYLNFPLSDYDDCTQRYGVDLTKYLLDIVDKGKEMVEMAKNASRVTEQTEYSARLRRVYQQNKTLREQCDALVSENADIYKFHTTNCGVCINCRQPWLDRVCVRYKEAKDLEYKFREHARMIVDGPELSAYKTAISRAKSEGKKDLAQRITAAMYSRYPLPDILQNQPVVVARDGGKDEDKTDGPSKEVEDKEYKDSLEWIIKPFPNKRTREFNRKHTESAHAQLQLQLASSVNQEMAHMKAAALEYDAQNVSEFQMKKKNPNRKVYEEFLSSIDQSVVEGSDVLFIREDAPIWIRPNTYKLNQCSYCKTWHRPHLEYCPLMQATCALPKDSDKKEPLCLVCKDEGEDCRACLVRCSIPEFLHHPFRSPAPFLSNISPDMRSLLASMKNISDAAISEFKSPHISGLLTPESMLALALVAEAMVDRAIERKV